MTRDADPFPFNLPDDLFADLTADVTPPPRPFDWDALDPDELEQRWRTLDRWVDWLRTTYGLPATVIPPAWHRHPELHLELSALHLHHQSAHHPDSPASAPNGWHRDLADTITRLRDWTATAGTRLDTDRPTRQTRWPGDPPHPDPADSPITDRTADFEQHLTDQIAHRRARQLTAQETT
jgi:hypothetical protein